MDTLVLLGAFTVLCALGVPVAYSLGLGAIVGALWSDIPLEAVMLKISDGTDDFALLAIPFFVLAGGIMAEGGMAARLINLARIFVGAIRGGLALVNVLASTLFGCISGSSVADTASIGSVLIPQMVRQGYPKVFATNVTICGSVQAVLIPPSHNAVLYALACGGSVSVAGLFLAGVLPGLLIIGLLVIYAMAVGGFAKLARSKFDAKEALAALWEAKYELFIPVVGPWVDLGNRDCATRSCGNDDVAKAMIISSGIAQGVGVLLGVGSLFVPESTTTRTRNEVTSKAEVTFTPVSYGSGAGLGAVGRF